jgi:hypothetical protein
VRECRSRIRGIPVRWGARAGPTHARRRLNREERGAGNGEGEAVGDATAAEN